MLGSSAWRDAAVERRFDLIARRIAEVAAAATRNAEVPGIYWEYSVAQRNSDRHSPRQTRSCPRHSSPTTVSTPRQCGSAASAPTTPRRDRKRAETAHEQHDPRRGHPLAMGASDEPPPRG